jgi:hypothetical protein
MTYKDATISDNANFVIKKIGSSKELYPQMMVAAKEPHVIRETMHIEPLLHSIKWLNQQAINFKFFVGEIQQINERWALLAHKVIFLFDTDEDVIDFEFYLENVL